MPRSPFDLLSLGLRPIIPLAAAVLLLAGCQKSGSNQTSFQQGEAITAGPLRYNVIQTSWRTELGDVLTRRSPQNRFLLVSISATNEGHSVLPLPFFALEGEAQKEFPEAQDGAGVNRWFGLLRELQPGETRQGVLLFDVPLKSYRLRLTDGGEPGSEKYVWVDIPLNLDTDTDTRIVIPNVNGQ